MRSLLLLPLALAHPPKDAPLDSDEVMGAANAVMDDMKTSIPRTFGQWHVLSAQKQVVSGLSFTLVIAVATTESPWPTWWLCSASAYTSFGEPATWEVRDVTWTHEATTGVPRIDGVTVDDCSAELGSPQPLRSTATVQVTVMSGGGGGGGMEIGGGGGGVFGGRRLQVGGGGSSFVSHNETVSLRESWRMCGTGLNKDWYKISSTDARLRQMVVATDRQGNEIALSTHETALPVDAKTCLDDEYNVRAHDFVFLLVFVCGLALSVIGARHFGLFCFARAPVSPQAIQRSSTTAGASPWGLNDAAREAEAEKL